MLANNHHKTSKELRFMPDFVVQSTQNGDLFYLEVKFRANGTFGFDERFENYPYKNAWFVVVSPQKIQCMHYRHLAKGNMITPESSYTLGRVRSFHFSAESIQEYTDYARLLFGAFNAEK